MTTECHSFGPWTTSLDNGSRLELSAFWSRRMNALAGLASASPATRWSVVLPSVVAAALAVTPMLEFHRDEARAQEASVAEETPLLHLSSRAAPPTEAERDAMNAKYQRAHELQQELARSHGYRLAPGELVKFIPAERSGDVRRELLKLLLGDRQGLLTFVETDGELRQLTAHMDNANLARLLDIALGIKLHRVMSDPAILDLALDGDLLFASEPAAYSNLGPDEKFHAEETLVESLEKTLNETLRDPLKFDLKIVDRPSLVARGDYQFTAVPDENGKFDRIDGRVAEQAEGGTFQFPGRRDEIAASVGGFSEMLEDVGELLLLPIIDEIGVRPTKAAYFWNFAKKPAVEGQTPLDASTTEAVIAALAEQTGLTFAQEVRPVQMLFIEPAGKQADAAR